MLRRTFVQSSFFLHQCYIFTNTDVDVWMMSKRMTSSIYILFKKPKKSRCQILSIRVLRRLIVLLIFSCFRPRHLLYTQWHGKFPFFYRSLKSIIIHLNDSLKWLQSYGLRWYLHCERLWYNCLIMTAVLLIGALFFANRTSDGTLQMSIHFLFPSREVHVMIRMIL